MVPTPKRGILCEYGLGVLDDVVDGFATAASAATTAHNAAAAAFTNATANAAVSAARPLLLPLRQLLELVLGRDCGKLLVCDVSLALEHLLLRQKGLAERRRGREKAAEALDLRGLRVVDIHPGYYGLYNSNQANHPRRRARAMARSGVAPQMS